MLDQDDSHAGVGGKRREKGAKGFKPAGGGADRGHREVGLALGNDGLLGSAWPP